VALAALIVLGAPAAMAAGTAIGASSSAVTSSAPRSGLPGGDGDFLKAEEAFRLSARALDDRSVEVSFDVADGYYLYRDKLAFAVEPGKLRPGSPALPRGERKHDPYFGDVDTYRGRLVVRLALAEPQPGRTVLLKADSQGCADAGLCYPPMAQQLRIAMPAAGAGPGPVVEVRKKGWFN
jgi:thiol:disulfide interchange protein DsbD